MAHLSIPSWVGLDTAGKAKIISDVYKDGFSASDIAREISYLLGVSLTRNAIIGVYHRNKELATSFPLGTQVKKEKAPSKPRTPKPVKSVNVKKEEPLSTPFLLPEHRRVNNGPLALPESLGLRLEELDSNQCKFPINDGSPFLFCGCPRRKGSPYCLTHHNRSFYRIISKKAS